MIYGKVLEWLRQGSEFMNLFNKILTLLKFTISYTNIKD